MMFRLGKLLLIHATCFCIEFSQALLMPYGRFVVTPQVFSSIIALHLHCISISMHHSCLLFYVMQHM
jgi:hypothetical protein